MKTYWIVLALNVGITAMIIATLAAVRGEHLASPGMLYALVTPMLIQFAVEFARAY